MRPQQVKDEIKRSNVGGEHNENKKSWSLVTVFDISNVKDGFRGVFKKRDKNRRFFILLLITSFTLTIFCSSIYSVNFLFYRKQFKWGTSGIGMYLGFFGFVGIFAQYVAVPFLSETVKLHDSTIVLIAIAGSAVSLVIKAFIPKDLSWILYISSAF